tara:strand:+ start:2376 stop:2954 length:579 start_codon:yes stop_codon:yes gene_type:complete
MVAHSRLNIANAPSWYPRTTEVFNYINQIEEELDALSDLQDGLQAAEDNEQALKIQGKIGESFEEADSLINKCQIEEEKLASSGAELRKTSKSFSLSLDALQKRLNEAKDKEFGSLARQSTANELSDSQLKVNSEFLQVVVFFSILIVVALLCARSVATKDSRQYEMGLIALILALLAYYIITKFLSPQPFF